ncbi:MAG: helix-turn-helix transcriptional regulator [Lachnospiraceae bacterium]|nr:helix-turn-helix transcriptional regulator [Lachnospiraceae bacterium]
MILADKIINERKKNGWSQEELAEMLSVSRQSVSKWEGAQAVPDLNKIIKMAEIFGVSTDYLLKDEIEISDRIEGIEESENNNNIRKVSLEEATKYINLIKKNTPSAVIATILLTLCPVALIQLSGIASNPNSLLPVNIAVLIGLIILFISVAVGSVIWIGIELKEKEFKYLAYEEFETLYGVDGMIKEKKKAFDIKRIPCLFISVVLFVLSPIGVITAALLNASALTVITMVSLLLIMVAIGSGLIIYIYRIDRSYDNLLKEGRVSKEQKKAKKVKSRLGGIYWCIVVAIYLILGNLFDLWYLSGVIFPVAGVLFAAYIGIVKIFSDKD